MPTTAKNLPIFNSDKELSQFLHQNLTESLKQAIRVTVKLMIKEEMEQVRQDLDEKLSFNGYYQRNLLSPVGKVSNIPVARFRQVPGNETPLASLGVFDQEKERFFQLLAEMHRLGISQRKIKNLAASVFGIRISKNRVGFLHKELAEEESLKINQTHLNEPYAFLVLDGVWVACKQFGLAERNKAVLLCALGILPTGQRKIIGFTVATAEDYEQWCEFVASLKQRGLTGTSLKLIISDDNTALTKALAQIYPSMPLQVCIAHKMRNVVNATSYQHRPAVCEDLKAIYNAPTKQVALTQMQHFCKRWYVVAESATRKLRFNFERTLTYFAFPEEQWKRIRTSNVLEREFRELRRRIKVFDSSFEDVASVERYGSTIFNHLNNTYPASLHTKS